MNTIFDNHSTVFTASDPQAGWLFNIWFQSENAGADEVLKNLVPLNISLPTYETIVVERSFLGTEKSFPIKRKYAGDTDMEFIIRSENDDSSLFNNLAMTKQTQQGFKHFELDRTYNKIMVQLVDRKGEVNAVYKYFNAIVTNFSMTDLSYEGEDMVKCTLSFHYDFWTKD